MAHGHALGQAHEWQSLISTYAPKTTDWSLQRQSLAIVRSSLGKLTNSCTIVGMRHPSYVAELVPGNCIATTEKEYISAIPQNLWEELEKSNILRYVGQIQRINFC
jgi:hypothetical protein